MAGPVSYPPLPPPTDDEPGQEIASDAGTGKDIDMSNNNPTPPEDKKVKRDKMHQDLYYAAKRINKLAPDDYYGFLNLSKDCDSPNIKAQYRELAKSVHPDKNKLPYARQAFQRISEAYIVLKDPAQRKKYDAQDRGGYNAPDVDADGMYQEEFHEDAFGDDSASENDDTDDEDSGLKPKLKPNDAHRKIYNAATPFIQKVLSNPPKTDADKKANAEQAKTFNKDIAEQNEKDGIEDKFQCQIDYVVFESNALFAAPWVERLKKDPKHSKAKEYIDFLDNVLKSTNQKSGYPEVWTLGASIFPEGKPKTRKPPPAGNGSQPPERETVTRWEPGYTLHGEKIIAHIPRERTVRKLVKGVRQPAEKITFGYQFIVKDEEEETIALVSGQEIGQRATEGYLGQSEDKLLDARCSEKRYTLDDADSFLRLIDFASNPFKTRSSNELRHPPGYGLVEFKDGSEHVLSRAGLRKLLGERDADWEIQECDKNQNRIPAWKIKPLGWREPKQMMIESSSKRVQRQRQIKDIDSDQSDSDTLFLNQKRPGRRSRDNRDRGYISGSAKNRGRHISRRPAESREASRSSHISSWSQPAEVADLRNEVAELTKMIKGLVTGLSPPMP